MSPRGVRELVSRTPFVVVGAVAFAVAVRLPLLQLPAWADEAGYLTVGGGWHLGDAPGPDSLYGAYWVDRPPVLVGLYGLAERLGGLVELRLLGALAAAVTVAALAWIGRTVAGPRAAGWAAVTGAALLSTPYHWAFMVDGELVAAPFVALGIALLLSGLARDGRPGLLLSAAAGVMALAALLTKQNIADVFVFATALVAIGLLRRTLRPGQAARHLGAFSAGVLGFGAAVAGWTLAHGTTLGAVFYAMYPFRLDAADGTAGGIAVSRSRLTEMGLAAVLSGLVLLALWVTVSGVRRSHRDAPVLALLAVLGFDLFSVAAGTNYWLHYLIQPAVPVAALTGILVARGSLVRFLSMGAVATALVAWVVLVMSPPQTAEEVVGESIAVAAAPHDSILTLPGRANVDYASGLSSPYPHLWALPAHTLDPGGVQLRALLAGPRAPTWVVLFEPIRRHPPEGTVAASIVEHYRAVTHVCGEAIYLERGLQRSAPTPSTPPGATRASRCESVTVLPHLLRALS